MILRRGGGLGHGHKSLVPGGLRRHEFAAVRHHDCTAAGPISARAAISRPTTSAWPLSDAAIRGVQSLRMRLPVWRP